MAKPSQVAAMKNEVMNLRKAFTEKLAKFKLAEEENKKLKSDLEKSEMMCSGLKTGVSVLEERIKEKDILISQLQSEVTEFKNKANLLKEDIMALPDGEDE